MARSVNIKNLAFSVLSVEGDAIQAKFHQTKKDQEGDKYTGAKHMYANPENPEVCINLALGLYLLTNPGIEGKALFPGNETQKVFAGQMKDFLNTDDGLILLETLGHVPEDFGVHSPRKGAGSACATGSTAGPGAIPVAIRMGWKLGQMMDVYLKEGQASDQFVGRVVALLNLQSARFAILPPHFVGTPEEMAKVVKAVKTVFPGLHGKSEYTPAVLQRVLASVVWHARPGGYLSKVLDKTSSPLFRTPLFTIPNILPMLTKLVVCGTQEELADTKSTMKPTGIPPHVTLMAQFAKVVNRLDGLETQVSQANLKAIFMEAADAVDHQRGQLTQAGMQSIFGTLLKKALAPIEARIGVTTPSVVAPVAKPSGAMMFQWDDGSMMKKLPQNFVLPGGKVVKGTRLVKTAVTIANGWVTNIAPHYLG